MCFLIYLFFNICTLSKSLFRGMEVLRSWVESNFDLKDRVAVERALGHSPYRRASVRYPPLLGGTVQRSVVLRADKTAAWGDAKTLARCILKRRQHRPPASAWAHVAAYVRDSLSLFAGEVRSSAFCAVLAQLWHAVALNKAEETEESFRCGCRGTDRFRRKHRGLMAKWPCTVWLIVRRRSTIFLLGLLYRILTVL